MRVVLIRTSSPNAKGSMAEYACMVESALRASGRYDVQTCDLFPACSRSMWRDHVWRLVHAGQVLRQQQADIYHLLDGSMLAFLPKALLSKTIVTVHDLIPWLQLQGELPGRPSLAASWIIRQSVGKLRNVAGLHGVSLCTVRDIQRVTGRTDAAVISHATRSLPVFSSDLRLPEKFVLHIGNNAAYKNRMGALRVFARLADMKDLWLIMAGPPPTDALRAEAAKRRRVRFMVDISDADLAALYQRATLLLFPSLYEGFGIPVREAQAAGCPVVCSTAASLPEVAGHAALMADPKDEEGLAAHCRTLLSDDALRSHLVEKGKAFATAFTMERFGADLCGWYESIGKCNSS